MGLPLLKGREELVRLMPNRMKDPTGSHDGRKIEGK
jgi:hypothetical protein